MLTTGIEQLQKTEDVLYLREAFQVEKTEEEAKEYFENLIKKAIKNVRGKFNDAIHIVAHPHKDKEQ